MRELNGWAPATIFYSPDGEVVSIAVTESRFSREDVALLLASRRLERAPRGRHGHLLSEATDPKNQFAWKASKPIRDFAQAAIDKAQSTYARTHKGADDIDSLLWGVSLERTEKGTP